jgi:hypothetical protein
VLGYLGLATFQAVVALAGYSVVLLLLASRTLRDVE